MTEISQVLVIGANEYAQKIQAALAKSGARVASAAKGEKPPFAADLIIEAEPGDITAKRKALLAAAAGSPEAIMATTLPGGITGLAAGTGREGRVSGLYFMFNPFEDKTVVQIVKGLGTSADTVEACRRLVEKAGAVPVILKDVPGLIVDRVMAATINEAAFMLQTELASVDDINRVPKLCLNWPAGPFEFADMIGIDNVIATLEAAAKDGQQYLPCRYLRDMAAAGRLGKKSGTGFFNYATKA